MKKYTYISGAGGKSWLKFPSLSSVSSLLQDTPLVKCTIRSPSLLCWDLMTRLQIASSLTTLGRLFVTLLFVCCRQLQWNGHCTVRRHRGEHCYRSFPHDPWPVVSLHSESPGTFCCFIFCLNWCRAGCVVEGKPGAGTQKTWNVWDSGIRK